ncbi:hypothetical protein NL533_36185, partial [Klebsiella pneumoniae]|nr:hypothetical protein [Klebsiella pneumoniae]
IALLLASTATGAFATDFGDGGPAATDWSGFYAGVLGGAYNNGTQGVVEGVVGVNFLPSEMILLGIEGSAGAYFDTGG